MDTYGHLFPSQNREWVNKLDEPDEKVEKPVSTPDSAVYVPATYPAPEQIPYEVGPRNDKAIDSKGELDGGGDPDRTGDPRLMSPLLYQLSYTATMRQRRVPMIAEEEGQCLPNASRNRTRTLEERSQNLLWSSGRYP